MSGKFKGKLNIRFKFDDSTSEGKSDEVLFQVFDILLNSQKGLIKAEKNNENNRNTNRSDKAK